MVIFDLRRRLPPGGADMIRETTPWRAMREATRLTMNEVGRRAGISSGRMSIIERGVRPSEDEERRLKAVLAEALGLMGAQCEAAGRGV